jgi:hypothetical protein
VRQLIAHVIKSRRNVPSHGVCVKAPVLNHSCVIDPAIYTHFHSWRMLSTSARQDVLVPFGVRQTRSTFVGYDCIPSDHLPVR